MIDPIYAEVAAAGFFVLLFFADLVKKQLPIRRTIFFQLLLCGLMLSSFFAIDAELSLQYGESTELTMGLQIVYLCTRYLCFGLMHCYIMSIAGRMKIQWTATTSIALVSVFFAVMALITTPWNQYCFEITKDGKIHHTVLFWGLEAFMMSSLVFDIVMLWTSCTHLTVKKKMLSTLLIIGSLIGNRAAISENNTFVIFRLLTVFAVYTFYLSLQSPDFYVDNATGNYNRNGFFEVLQEKIGYGITTSCLIIRVRNINAMNQIYGGEVIRKIQRKIGKILVSENKEGCVYHIGSSTFAVMTKNRKETEQLFKKALEIIPETWELDGQIVNQEYSFYEISYPDDGEDFEELVQRIHYARSDHESHHSSKVLVHLRQEAIEQAEEKKEVAHLVEEAIMDNSLELNFQPIFSFEKNKITSLEVLSRLKDHNKRYINPEFFIHVAEENHTIIPLGEQIFRKACIFASQNHVFDYGIEDININLSPAQCRYEGLTDDLVAIAEEYGIPMEKMHLEITESEFTDKDAVERTLKRLKETGAKVALDDFGTGNSTLSNILELPVDFVKIDKSLVWSFAEGKNQFLNDLMPMIKAEGKQIIAEGIETTEHIDIIKRLQGDYLQGYYYSKPLPEAEFMRFLKGFNGKLENSQKEQDDNLIRNLG